MGADLKTFTDLENCLIEKGINPKAIAINIIPKDNQYCIQWDGELAEVYYFERGIKMELATFKEKASAMQHFLSIVLADKSVYLGHRPGH